MRRTARALSVAVLAGVALGGPAGDVRAEPGPDPGAESGTGPAGTSSSAPHAATRPPARPEGRAGEETGARPDGRPTAEVSPPTVRPGGSVTVTVFCGPGEGPAPKTIEAMSEAFAEGVADLGRVPGENQASGPVYRGTARIAPAAELGTEPGATTGDRGDARDPRDPGDPGASAGADPHPPGPDGPAGAGPADPVPDGPAHSDVADPVPGGTPRAAPAALSGPVPGAPGPGASVPGAPGPAGTRPAPDSRWTVDGTCPAPPGAEGAEWSATFAVTRGGRPPTAPPDGHRPCPEPHPGGPCDDPGARGVHAGEGGTFTHSVPALAAGGLFIAAALGGAVYRLRPGRPAREE
ncbi:MAG TPA: hypothetical protein VFP69_02245 [Streptomyces sp.]|nr:hypothetical protein [Streptomyces sp.]